MVQLMAHLASSLTRLTRSLARSLPVERMPPLASVFLRALSFKHFGCRAATAANETYTNQPASSHRTDAGRRTERASVRDGVVRSV